MDRSAKPAVYNTTDQMIVSAARQIKDNDVVFVGTGLPMVATLLAKYTHAPNCSIVTENGTIKTALFTLPFGTDTLGMQTQADLLSDLFYVNCLAQAGFIDKGFLGAGQIDRYGNINDNLIGDYHKPVYRFIGSGGANDVMTFCRRTIVIIRQSKRRFPEKVDFLTCPGYLDGRPGQREEEGLPPNTGPSVVITNLGVYEFEDREMVLKSIHSGAGVTLDQVKAETGWNIKVSPDLKDTEPPTDEELHVFHTKVDPEQIWVDGKRAT